MHDEKWRQIPVSEKVPSNSGWLVVGLVLGHQRRQLLGFAVTERSGWRNKSPKHSPGTAPKYLIRDDDRAFGDAFTEGAVCYTRDD